MRDCYKKFWKTVLVEKMRDAFPQFALREGAARKAADEAKPSSKPIKFAWNPVGKLVFTIEYDARGKQDDFQAWFFWSETGKLGPNGTASLDFPFREDSYELANATVMLQTLSAALNDDPRVFRWPFWQPATSLFDDREAWHAEFMAEERRAISDAEARQRVEAAVDKAMMDIKRGALPWFEKKLGWYKEHRIN